MKHMSQGDAVLDLFGFDSTNIIDFELYLNDRIIENILKKVGGHTELQKMFRAILLDIREKKQVRISNILDQIILHLHQEDFIFKKE